MSNITNNVASGKPVFIQRGGSWSTRYLTNFEDLFTKDDNNVVYRFTTLDFKYFSIKHDMYNKIPNTYYIMAHFVENGDKEIFLGWIYNLPVIYYSDGDPYVGIYDKDGNKI